MSPKTPPGETRERIYRYLVERLRRGDPPTVREVQAAFGFRAVQTAREHLERLVEEGRLAKAAGKARGYTLPQLDRAKSLGAGSLGGGSLGGEPVEWIPVLGRVAAGALQEAIENPQGHVPGVLRGSGTFFALEVEGDSMIDVGILPGDLVIVRAQPTAESGDIVVALVDDEATVKRLRIRRGRIELHAENPAYAPIRPRKHEEVRILGKVAEVRRRML